MRFVVKNPTGLCEVCGEEPEACVRFAAKNQRPVGDVWRRTKRPV